MKSIVKTLSITISSTSEIVVFAFSTFLWFLSFVFYVQFLQHLKESYHFFLWWSTLKNWNKLSLMIKLWVWSFLFPMGVEFNKDWNVPVTGGLESATQFGVTFNYCWWWWLVSSSKLIPLTFVLGGNHKYLHFASSLGWKSESVGWSVVESFGFF